MKLNLLCDKNLLKLHQTLAEIWQRERVSHVECFVVAFSLNFYSNEKIFHEQLTFDSPSLEFQIPNTNYQLAPIFSDPITAMK